MCEITARGQTLALPVKAPVSHKVYRRSLPCYVILVHGVNDVGEAYEAQERGLCLGLADRLGRNGDLKPYEYRLPRTDRADPLEPVPDRVYYRRIEGPGSHSPVIPFYWGFREENESIRKHEKQARGEWLDRCGNRIDKDGAKGGGPFQNACNCLPHMWAGGWRPGLPGRAAGAFSSPTHPLDRSGPDRRYFVLAALRLAMLVRIIRKRHPKAAVNVVAHSMGCLVTLLAQAFLMDEGHPPADALVLNNPPYSFEENALDAALYEGLNQTSRARIETLRRLVKAFHERRAQQPSWAEIRQGGDPDLAWKPWTKGLKKATGTGAPEPCAERDNRGKTYLYFSPHDQTVALANTQGIGWQGVPDRYEAEWDEEIPEHERPVTFRGVPLRRRRAGVLAWSALLEDLGASGFRQRLFMSQVREGRPFRVGLPPGPMSLLEAQDHYPGWFHRLIGLKRSLPRHLQRTVNGEPLAPPVEFSLGPDALPVSPIDAAVALAHGAPARSIEESLDDPRPADRREPLCPPLLIPPGHWDPLRDLLNRGKPPEQQFREIRYAREIMDEGGAPTGRILVGRDETPDEIRQRWQHEGLEENSRHSAIVAHPWHSQTVTAYDLAVTTSIIWTEKEERFYAYLCEVADWRIKVDKPGDPGARPQAQSKITLLKATGFYDQEDARNKELIEATALYYARGRFPTQVDQAKTADRLADFIHFETTGRRAPVA